MCFINNTKNVHVIFNGLEIVSIKQAFLCCLLFFFNFFQTFVNFLVHFKNRNNTETVHVSKNSTKNVSILRKQNRKCVFHNKFAFQVQLYFNKQVHFFCCLLFFFIFSNTSSFFLIPQKNETEQKMYMF